MTDSNERENPELGNTDVGSEDIIADEPQDEASMADSELENIDVDDYLADSPDDATLEAQIKEERKQTFTQSLQRFSWSDQFTRLRKKYERVAADDQEAIRDIRTAPQRFFEYAKVTPKIRAEAIDSILPLTLLVYGLAIFIVAQFATGDLAYLLTVPDRLADIYLLISLVTIGSIIALSYSRQAYEDTERIKQMRDQIRKYSLAVSSVPFIIGTVAAVLIILGNVETIFSISEQFASFRASVSAVLPGVISNTLSAIWNLTPIGVTLVQVSLVMTLIGAIGFVLNTKELVKVSLVTVNNGYNPRVTELEEEIESDEIDVLEDIDGLESVYENFTQDDLDRLTSGEDVEMNEDINLTTDPVSYGSAKDLMKSSGSYEIETHDGFIEEERYWLREPYSFAVILKHKEREQYRYYAEEPRLEKGDHELLEIIREGIDRKLGDRDLPDPDLQKDEREERLRREIEQMAFEVAKENNLDFTHSRFHRIMYHLDIEYLGYGPIDTLMNDPNIEDISLIQPDEPLWVVHGKYDSIQTNIKYNKTQAKEFIQMLSSRSEESISIGDPRTDATLPDGSRAQLTLGEEVSDFGSNFTIRQFQEAPFSPVDLIRTNTFSPEQMAYLWVSIENKSSLIFAGGTASGKTTSMNAVSLFIPPTDKVISLEDTREVELPHNYWVASKTRSSAGSDEDGDIGLYDLLEDALRQRPTYLVVGEVRGSGARDLFQAMSTGHTAYSTMHASSVSEALNRLQNDPMNVPTAMIISALDIICIQNRVVQDGDSHRRNEFIDEVIDNSGGGGASLSTRTVSKYLPDEKIFETKFNNSEVLDSIREERGWTRKQIQDEVDDRIEVLEYMVDEDIYDYRKVTRIIQQYMKDKTVIMEMIESDELKDVELEDITNVNLEELEKRIHPTGSDDIMPGEYDRASEQLEM